MLCNKSRKKRRVRGKTKMHLQWHPANVDMKLQMLCFSIKLHRITDFVSGKALAWSFLEKTFNYWVSNRDFHFMDYVKWLCVVCEIPEYTRFWLCPRNLQRAQYEEIIFLQATRSLIINDCRHMLSIDLLWLLTVSMICYSNSRHFINTTRPLLASNNHHNPHRYGSGHAVKSGSKSCTPKVKIMTKRRNSLSYDVYLLKFGDIWRHL